MLLLVSPGILAPSRVLISLDLCLFHVAVTTGIFTLSLHDALPISVDAGGGHQCAAQPVAGGLPMGELRGGVRTGDRKSTRLNSSHVAISYAVFCLKKKKTKQK